MPFDEKVSAQVIFYGMPQLRIGTGSPTPPASAPIAADPSTQLDATPVVLSGTPGIELSSVGARMH